MNALGGDLLAPHTTGPRDVPRCGALSLLQKTLHNRGDPAETAAGLNAELWVLVVVVVVVSYPFSGTAEPTPLFESIWTFERNFESSKEPFLGNFDPRTRAE